MEQQIQISLNVRENELVKQGHFPKQGKSRLVIRRNGRQLVSVSLILVHRSVV